MRPGFRSSMAASLWRWDSPLPYLFAGLAAMMGLVIGALIMLVCSDRKSSSSASSPSPSSRNDGAAGESVALAPLDMEPRIVVVMAGDTIPSFLAKAVPSAAQTSQH